MLYMFFVREERLAVGWQLKGSRTGGENGGSSDGK